MKHHLKQLIPSEICLACEVCCRYPDRQTLMAPVFSREEQQKAVELGLPKQSFPTPEPGRGARIRVTTGESSSTASFDKLRTLSERSESNGLTTSCYQCPAFVPGTHECTIYPERPFDCQLYPFMLMFSQHKSKVHLIMDPLCPFIQTHNNPLSPNPLTAYGRYLYDYLEQPEIIQWICQNQNLVSEYQDSMIRVRDLEKLTKSLVPEPIQQGLTPLTSRDFDRFQKAFSRKKPILSCEHFLFHYLWNDSLRYYWTEMNGYLCLFAETGNHLFMPVPPMDVGARRAVPLPEIVEECFNIMNFWNQNRAVSRIAGIREEDIVNVGATPRGCPPGAGTGARPYTVTLVEHDYLYRRIDLVNLKGNTYKSKRASYNQFLRNHPAAIYHPFTKEDIPACLHLYQTWLAQYKERRLDSSASSFDKLRTLSERSESNGLTIRKHEIEMAEENFKVHQKAFLETVGARPFDGAQGKRAVPLLIGRVIEINGEISGYTFGVPLSSEIFYILFEITDLTIKGISQYLFREFCRELEPYPFIHAGGDSGLDSLRRVKESYHPLKKYPVYQISQL